MNEKNTFWECAGKAGLILGGVSILYAALLTLIGVVNPEGTSTFLALLRVLLWLAKLVGCILLMRFFMSRFALANPDADRSRVFRFGMAAALLSALLYSGAHLAYLSLNPGIFEEAIASVVESNPMVTDEMAALMTDLAPRMPTYMFFGNLGYCFLFGTILSAIFSSSIRPNNPFAE